MNINILNICVVLIKVWYYILLGVWFMHCHLEIHTTWGLKMAFVVDNGKGPNESILPPPSDLPKCWEMYLLTLKCHIPSKKKTLKCHMKRTTYFNVMNKQAQWQDFLGTWEEQDVQLTFIGLFLFPVSCVFFIVCTHFASSWIKF